MSLLEVCNLRTFFFTLTGVVKAVDRVSFTLQRDEAVGLAGESGCGKSTTALSLMRLIKPPGKIVGGTILFNQQDVLGKTREEMDEIRWKCISYIPQAAMNALDPVHTVGKQIREAILAHEKIPEREANGRASELMALVGLDPVRLQSYPHELSGGMRQRAIIAMALSCNPNLVIADEPTTALDVVVQRQILRLIDRLRSRLGLSLLLITHDLSVIAETCDKTAIMYAGKIVENASTSRLFSRPLHPYTQGLIKSVPSIAGPKGKLSSIPGFPPSLVDPPHGCRFCERCPYAQPVCTKEEPELRSIEKDHLAACHFAEDFLQ